MNELILTYIFQVAKLVFINPEVIVCHVVFFIMAMDVRWNATVLKMIAIMFMDVKMSLQVIFYL